MRVELRARISPSKILFIIHYLLFILLSVFLGAQETDNSPLPYDFTLPQDPTKAALLSAVIPGAGQIYNEKYIKAPIVICVQTGLVLRTVYWDTRYKDYRSKLKREEEYEGQHYNNRIKYNEAWEARQSYIFWVGASVLLSAIDAYVDAHLINFKTKKNEIHLMFEGEKLVLSVKF